VEAVEAEEDVRCRVAAEEHSTSVLPVKTEVVVGIQAVEDGVVAVVVVVALERIVVVEEGESGTRVVAVRLHVGTLVVAASFVAQWWTMQWVVDQEEKVGYSTVAAVGSTRQDRCRHSSTTWSVVDVSVSSCYSGFGAIGWNPPKYDVQVPWYSLRMYQRQYNGEND
jgi:hypothetical protein